MDNSLSSTKLAILQKYGISSNDLIRKGMEAEVYVFNANSVLKLYAGTTSLAHLITLQHFYASLERSAVSYSLPWIQSVQAEGDFCISVERQLTGNPMSSLLHMLDRKQMDEMMQVYLTTALELSNILILPEFERYKLFDTDGISHRADGDWHQFLARYLAQKLIQVMHYLSNDVHNFDKKVKRMYEILAQPYTGTYNLIHGDFFPGNILVDDIYRVTALLDFGLLTMYGDPLFDIATGWVFFDMYDELKANARERILPLIAETLGKHVCGRLYRYVLFYSMISANTYSPNCADGHYQWCVANLNKQEYWNKIE